MIGTDLSLEIINQGNLITPFSARECRQTLTTIPQAVFRRTVNGELKCVNSAGHKKFQSTIQCKDRAPPAFDGAWKGVTLKVNCIQYVTHIVPAESVSIQVDREGVDHTLFDNKGKIWSATPTQNRWVSIQPSFPGGFLTYKPILMMMIKSYTLETDEWGLTVGWTLDLDEI